MQCLAKICKTSVRSSFQRKSRNVGSYLEYKRRLHKKETHYAATVELIREGDKAVNSKPLQEPDEESIIISGISGRFPSADNMKELKENLTNGVDMIVENDRFAKIVPRAPSRMGLMKNADKFDAGFFNITSHMASAMDINMRKLLEVSFEAVVDAGINPTTLRGTRTGVFIGTQGGESQDYWSTKGAVNELEGYKLLGVPNYFQPARVSYHFDLHGPSLAIATGCSSSLMALDAAIKAIRMGDCDQAIVAATQIHMTNFGSMELASLSAVALDGRSKVFDDSADGFTRSESVAALMIQRKRDAKRHYVTIRGIGANHDGYKREGLTFPSSAGQARLLKSTYKSSGVDPGHISYFEAHGTGTPAGDPQELMAISSVVAKAENRKDPLLVGSVKSNLGHTESAAGIVSIAKILISMEQGFIPANLHFKHPSSFVKDLFDGSLKVVDQQTPWDGDLVGVSSYGIGGSNAHLILERGPRLSAQNSNGQTKNEMPILIHVSGRTEALVKSSIEESSEIATNSESRALLHQVFQQNIPNHPFRGYGIFHPGQKEDPVISIEKQDSNESRPLWYIFPGMGSQWNEMGNELMKIEAYSESITTSKVSLKNVGIDLDCLLRPNNPSIFENARDSLVAITAVQIALFDTLAALKLTPDGFLGHSSGEVLCAYADGCLSREETLLINDARGRAFQEAISSPGGMASIGLSWEEAKECCPPGIYPACHNAAENVSVSGPQSDIENFVEQLKSEGIFARLVNSCHSAPHSEYVYPASDLIHKYMREIIQDDEPKPRSSKWISSSIPESKWDTPLAQTSSVAYHINNMQKPVLFHQAVLKIPKNAVVVEIAPRGLLQPILRQSLDSQCTLIAPMHHKVENKLTFFLSSVGKMYNAGINMDLGKLYPPVQFPVSSSTPNISSIVKWNHEKSWLVHAVKNLKEDSSMIYKIDLGERKLAFLEGHKLDQRCVFPATGYLVCIWQTFASKTGKYFLDVPVVFENVSFERATFLKHGNPLALKVSCHPISGSFVIEEDNSLVVSGNIRAIQDSSEIMFQAPLLPIPENPQRKSLNSDDIYKEFRLRGYNYTGQFRGIRNIDNEGKWAQVAWNGNWVSFLDTLAQTIVLSVLTRSTAVPVRIKTLCIDPIVFLNFVRSQEEQTSDPLEPIDNSRPMEKVRNSSPLNFDPQDTKKEVLIPVSIYSHLGLIKCPGIEVRGVTAIVVPRQNQKETLSVEEYLFRPYFDHSPNATNTNSLTSNVAQLFDLVLENTKVNKLKIFDVFTKAENSLANIVTDLISLKPKHQAQVTLLSTSAEIEKLDEKIRNASTVMERASINEIVPETGLVSNLLFLDSPQFLAKFSEHMQEETHLILRCPNTDITEDLNLNVPSELQILSEIKTERETFTLFKRVSTDKVAPSPHVMNSVCVDGEHFEWLPNLQKAMKEAAEKTCPRSRVYIYSQNNPESGILGMFKCLRLEDGGDKLRCIFDPEGKLSLTDFQNPTNELQQIIEKDLVTNVLQNGKLGSYRHIPMSQDAGAESKEVSHAYVNTLTPGDLSSLRWVESPLTYHNPVKNTTDSETQICNVHYAALNFRDIMLATAKLPVNSRDAHNPQDCSFGFEFSGVDSKGKRVMGCMGSKAMATSVLIGPDSIVFPVPDQWTLAEAATVPLVYATVYYAYFVRGGLQPGQSILIHSGTGGVGQAAINVALDQNCEIFTTVGTPEKKKRLLEMFPTIKPENIGNSRDCSFEEQIMQVTNGRGVDVILNSLADDKLQASVRCLATHGKFLEIGSYDAFKNSNLGMDVFLNDVGFESIKLNHILTKSWKTKEILTDKFNEGIKQEVIKPIAYTLFEKDKVEEAFRFMASGKHIGKVLIEVQKEENIGQTPKIMAVPRSYFDPAKVYVIIGGLGGMGLELANWLVDRGAKNLILTSRSGVFTGYQELCLRKWEEQGARIETPQVDLSSYDVAETFIKELTSNENQIGGIFNSGLVLRDGTIEDQTVEDFEAVAAPKTQVAKNLDKLTRQYCKEGLDYFVVFSSMACGRGNASQSNYGLANSVIEQICEERTKDGLHGLAIQWGVIGEVGAVAEGIFGAKLTGEEVFDGTLAQRISSCLDVLDMTLHQNASIVSSMVLAEDDGMRSKKIGLLENISNICGIKDMSTITPNMKLIDMGMDSLIGIEIKQLIERDYDTPLTAGELRSMTVSDLQMIEAGTYVKGQSLSKGNSNEAHPNEDRLIEILTGSPQVLVKMKTAVTEEEKEGNTPNLFIVHGHDGHSNKFTALAAKLPLNVFCFQLPHFSDGENNESEQTLECIARKYIQELQKVQPKGPYQISGYSAGGSIAFEMTTLLEKEYNEKVENIIILDGCCDWTHLNESEHNLMAANGLTDILSDGVNLSNVEKTKITEAMLEGDIDSNRKLVRQFSREKLPALDPEIMTNYFDKTTKLFDMIRKYKPGNVIGGQVTLIKAEEKTTFMSLVKDEKYYLQQHASKPVHTHTVQGNHHSFLDEEKVSETANIITDIVTQL